MPPAELHLRAIERGVVSEGGRLAYGRERAGESALLSAGRRRALREKGGMTVSAQRASGGPTGSPPAGDQPCAARCGRALIGGAPARRCTRLPLCQPRQRAGGAQSRSEETAGSQGAARARRKTDGKWPPHAASAEAACGGHILALRATGPFSVRCTTASLKRAPAGSGRSRDRLKLRPQLLGGVRMAGLERLLARYPHPDAAAIWHSISFAAFAKHRRGERAGNFFYSRPRPPSQRSSAEPPGARPGGSLVPLIHRRGGRLAAPLRKKSLSMDGWSLKGLMRMLLPEYDRACARVVRLAMRIHSRKERASTDRA